MRPSQCKKGMRIVYGAWHGTITHVVVSSAGPVANRTRRVMVTWDGATKPTEVDPADLKREVPPPLGDREKLERWLDS